MSLLNSLKFMIAAIKKNPIVHYLVLWVLSSVAVYLVFNFVFIELLYSLLWQVSLLVKSMEFAYFLIGCFISAIIVTFRYKKQPFDPKATLAPFIVLSVSLGSILWVIYDIIAWLITPQYNPLTRELFERYSWFTGSILLGAAIAGVIMLYNILNDNQKQKITRIL